MEVPVNNMMTPGAGKPEKFSVTELTALRNDLLQNGVDHWQAAEMLTLFLNGRGYGISRQSARAAIGRLEGACTMANIQTELNSLAKMV